jgi:hypothetical protein
MRLWSFAVFARKSSLQALRQKRRAQWRWQTRPNFPPQFAQRFSNLVMKLSSDLEVDGTTPQAQAIVCVGLDHPVRALRGAPSDAAVPGELLNNLTEIG